MTRFLPALLTPRVVSAFTSLSVANVRITRMSPCSPYALVPAPCESGPSDVFHRDAKKVSHYLKLGTPTLEPVQFSLSAQHFVSQHVSCRIVGDLIVFAVLIKISHRTVCLYSELIRSLLCSIHHMWSPARNGGSRIVGILYLVVFLSILFWI